jgi:predicted GH43/DUF377 family glycosyl hydrolase
MLSVKRSEDNPILSQNPNHPWEAGAAFNWSPVKSGKDVFVVYRAMSESDLMDPNHLRMSVVGVAKRKDDHLYTDRQVLISPEEYWEKYGCEDPRVTKLNGKFYIFYTAISKFPFTPDGIKIAVGITKDFKKIDERHLVTPFNAKAMALFPSKIKGKMAALLTVNPDHPPSEIAYVEFDEEKEIWSKEFWENWYKDLDKHTLPIRRNNGDQVELGSAPLKTEKGWLVFYSHIQNYNGGGPRVFGVEALLLDLENPRKIIGRTIWPILVPETHYERFGLVNDIVFPSGALIEKDEVKIFYGAADTHCATATVDLESLLQSLLETGWRSKVKRFANNPILSPREGKKWEINGVCNPAAIMIKNKIHLLYRAVDENNTSTIGYASTKDGFTIEERSEEPIYVGRANFEKKPDNKGGGCEDPRIIEIKDRLYMLYTAYDGVRPRVAMTNILTEDFINKKWNWSMPVLITPLNIDDKDAVIFPKKFDEQYLFIHRIQHSICADFVKSIDFKEELIDRCIEIVAPRPGMWDSKKVGASCPPIETKNGWLLFYHGISDHNVYRAGALLLNSKNPTEVIARSTVPILEPVEKYEREGKVNNVVFPCGAIIKDDQIFLYYGAADYCVGVATLPLKSIIDFLK